MDVGGRPPMFETPEDFQKKVDEYFVSVKEDVTTITGLALYLGFESRQSFYDYEKKEGFTYIVKNARMKVENAYEKKLFTQTCTGAIFALKNMGWDDRQSIKHEGLIPVMSLDPLADDKSNNGPQKDSGS